MRVLPLLFLFLSSPALGAEDDFARVALVATTSYDPRTEQGRGFKEFFSSIGVGIAGPGTDLGKLVSEKLDNPALRSYFPDPRERAALARGIADEVKRGYLANGYTNQSVDAAVRALTDRLVNTVVVRVLQREGVADAKRASAWATKIAAPFDRCVGLARAFGEAKKCAQPLENDLVKNVGLALTYELTRQEFGAASTGSYTACLKPAAPGADDRVRACALDGVRAAALSYARARLLRAAKKTLPDAVALAIADRTQPDLDRCLKAASGRAAFSACGDRFLRAAGAAIAQESLSRDPRVVAHFPDPAARATLAASVRDSFLRCMDENEKNNFREANGALRTDNCESFATLEASRGVALRIFRELADRTFATSPEAERAALAQGAAEALGGCWNSRKPEANANACLRDVTKRYAGQLADKRLGSQLPAGPERTRLLAALGDCLEKKLPRNLLHDEGAEASAAACANAATRDAGRTIAEARVRASLAGAMSDPDAVDAIVDSLVKKDFPSCLGDAPDDAKVDACTLRLEKDVASRAAAAELPARVDRFLDAGGGAAAYGLDEAGRKSLLDGVLASHAKCLHDNVTSVADAEAKVTSCFKDTVRNLALELGALELRKSANGLAVSDDDKGAVTLALGTCLDRRKEAKFSLTDYLRNLDACQKEVTAAAAVRLAKAGVHARFDKDAGGPTPALGKLDARLDECLARPGSAQGDCALVYVKDSSKELGRAIAEAQIAPMLGPQQLAALDGAFAKAREPFEKCVDAVPGPLGQAFLDGLDACSPQLTSAVFQFLTDHPQGGPAAPAPAPEVSKDDLTDMMARTVLCLQGNLAPADEKALKNIEPGSVEARLLDLIGSYIAYDLRAARGRYEDALPAIRNELASAGPEAARRKLLAALVGDGSADQLLKALVKRELEKSLAGKPLPDGLAAKLTEKAAIDRALPAEKLGALRPLLTASVLQPVLVEGRALDSSDVLRALRAVRAQALELVLADPGLGLDEATRAQVRDALKN